MNMIGILFYSILLCILVTSSVAIILICFNAYKDNEKENSGQITPDEKVKEWEAFKICAPGDVGTIEQARCKKFKNCHECLKDYANNQKECISIYKDIVVQNN